MTDTDYIDLTALNAEVPGALDWALAADADAAAPTIQYRVYDNIFGGSVVCRHCGSDQLIRTGRSLDRFNYDCNCGATDIHSMTETGASA